MILQLKLGYFWLSDSITQLFQKIKYNIGEGSVFHKKREPKESYNKHKYNIPDILLVSALNLNTSLYAAFIFISLLLQVF